jgi:hypothetical protein
MPSSESILTGLAAIANERRLIAEGWHVALGVFVLALKKKINYMINIV